MESHIVKIEAIDKITPDVLRITVQKPTGYNFLPGQATEVAINKQLWKDVKRPFTFTNLPADSHLEFIIKTYPGRKGMTNELLKARPGDELLLHDVWGAISYQGEGMFIAGGSGITPFLAILRHLHSINQINDNQLVFANKSRSDIIQEQELDKLLGYNFINILSHEKLPGYARGLVKKDFLQSVIKNPGGKFYVCGPPPMMDMVKQSLSDIGVSGQSVIIEI
jgi:ferredoxin-NADP reductase